MTIDSTTVLLVCLVAVFLVLRLRKGRRAAPSVVNDKLEAGATVVDVRTKAECRDGVFPGSKNIPLGELALRMAEIPKDKPVVVYCASGMRSASAVRTMKRAGYADVVNAGGLSDMPRG